MLKIQRFILNEFKGWLLWEVLWLIASCGVIGIIGIWQNDTNISIISAISGMAYVVLNGKGKPGAYIFGFVNSVLYAYISYKAKLYGETMLNLLYYTPMQFVGFYIWTRHINNNTNEIYKKKMNFSKKIITVSTILTGTLVYGFVLKRLCDAMPFTDAFTTVASVVGLIVAVKMYTEQWHIWFIVDFVTVIMWFRAYLNSKENIATLIMWIIYTITAVIMLIKWKKEIND